MATIKPFSPKRNYPPFGSDFMATLEEEFKKLDQQMQQRSTIDCAKVYRMHLYAKMLEAQAKVNRRALAAYMTRDGKAVDDRDIIGDCMVYKVSDEEAFATWRTFVEMAEEDED